MEDFWRVVQSMREAADAAGVKLVTGDTKVVDRGKADKIFINTSPLSLGRFHSRRRNSDGGFLAGRAVDARSR